MSMFTYVRLQEEEWEAFMPPVKKKQKTAEIPSTCTHTEQDQI